MTKNIDFVHIDADENYYNTAEQIRLKAVKWFIDTTKESVLSGSSIPINFFSRSNILKNKNTSGTSYVTSATVVDESGNSRKILAGTNDYLTFSAKDTFKQGVEILQQKHFLAAGIIKITAGTAGHFYNIDRYGITDAYENIVAVEDYYLELDKFNPVTFLEMGSTYNSSTTYSPNLKKSNLNHLEALIMDGVIEPLPIRPVISKFTINSPFEPRSFKGQVGNGNISRYNFSTDQVLSVDYRKIVKNNKAWYLEDNFYVNRQENYNFPFVEDGEKPRGYFLTSNYGSQLSLALLSLPSGGTTYVADDQVSSTCGFTFDNATLGTDSIAYGGLLY